MSIKFGTKLTITRSV